MRTLFFLALLAGCETTDITGFDHCTVQAELEPVAAAPGSDVVATGGPFSEVYDTRVRLGSTDATVTEVARTDCDACYDCRYTYDCDECETCSDCTTTCDDCIQTVTFTVPDLAPGELDVVITNRFGSTAPLPLEILEADTGDSSR